MVYLGVPLGSDAYNSKWLEAKLEELLVYAQRLAEFPESQMAFRFFTLCFNTSITHILRVLSTTGPGGVFAAKFSKLRLSLLVQGIIRIPMTLVGESTERQIEMLKSEGGLGLSNIAETHAAAYSLGGNYDIKRAANEDDDEDRIDDEGMVTEEEVSSDAMYCLVDHPTDPSAATWALQSARLNTPRDRHASIAFKKKIWVAGSDDSDDNELSSVEVYDAATNRWERAPNMTKG